MLDCGLGKSIPGAYHTFILYTKKKKVFIAGRAPTNFVMLNLIRGRHYVKTFFCRFNLFEDFENLNRLVIEESNFRE